MTNTRIFTKGLAAIYKKSFEDMMFHRKCTIDSDFHKLNESMKDLFVEGIGYVKYKLDVNITIKDVLFAEVEFKTN